MKSKLLTIMMVVALLLAGCAGMQPGGEAAESTPDQNVQSVVEPSDTTNAQTKQPKQTEQAQQVQLSPTECNANAQTAASECENQSDTTKHPDESTTTEQSKQTQTDSQQSPTDSSDSEQSTDQQTDQQSDEKTDDKKTDTGSDTDAPTDDKQSDDTQSDDKSDGEQSDTPDNSDDNQQDNGSDNTDDGQQDDPANNIPSCAMMHNQAGAQEAFNENPEKYAAWDKDDDGVPCEDLPTKEEWLDENSDGDKQPDNSTDTNESNNTDDGNNESDGSDDVPSGYAIKVIASGDWTGAIATGSGDTRSIEGSGTKIIDVEGSPSIVSANAQKQAANSETLTVQILMDGDVVAESSTSAEYGTAQVTTSPNNDDGGDKQQSAYSVKISYDGEWSGTVGQQGEMRSVDGSGTKTFDIDGSASIVVANGQKRDGSSGTLTVTILKNGEIVAQKSTDAKYGMVQVSTSN